MNDVFPDYLDVREAGFANGSALWKLTHYFRYVSSLGIITVPTGFITDGTSIPRCFWNILGPHGPYLPAAVVHDYLYSPWSKSHFPCDRYTADWLFKEAMWNLGIGWPTREIIYRGVRLGGWAAYQKSKKI